MKSKDIIKYAKELKAYHNTDDPYKIADYYGISIIHRDNCIKGFTAHTIKTQGYPTTISINNAYTEFSKKILCAHELGHALLHEDGCNHFAVTEKNVFTNIEQEANLFAIALLDDGSVKKHVAIPLEKMNNYMLKSIIDYNLKFNT